MHRGSKAEGTPGIESKHGKIGLNFEEIIFVALVFGQYDKIIFLKNPIS